ncbi:amidohydrolase [Nakamurella endophytica]|uniref:Hydrolase n=1 Tax=Nakamurella endophytica TaxID=1748367 RepID=A0A917WG23_9ACTN|nr:amidohydrolase [Nakamurella endophytica]GGM02292.1 hydrolase [Nakamurella endophytica]
MPSDATVPQPAPGPADLVITDVTSLVHGPDGAIDFRPGSTIVVRDGVIDFVGPVEGTPVPAAQVIDGRGQVAMPGLINCHTHSPMVLFRGAAENVSTVDWFNTRIWPMEVNLIPDDVEVGARLACAEMIAAGVTTFADHYFEMDRVARAVDETGLRANLGWTYFSSQGRAGFDTSLEFALSHRDAAGGRITTSLAPHGAYTVDDDDLRTTAAAALQHDLLVHIHAAESRAETRASRARRGMTPIAVLEHTGLLDARVLIAHAKGVVQEDLPLLARARGRVGVGSAPKGYLKQGEETTPIRSLLSAGVAVGLATDGAASNNTLDVWESMLVTALVQRVEEGDELWMTARDVLGLATLGSAAAVGLAGRIGSLAPGHQADIVLVDLSGPHTQPVHDLAATLVYSARSADISTTVVAGRVLMQDRRLLTVDVPAVVADLGPRLARLTDTSHGTSIQSYNAY